MRLTRSVPLFLTTALVLTGAAPARAAPRRQVLAALHVHSFISPEGNTSWQAIASLAGKKRIDALVPTDLFLRRWEYGLTPWPGLLRFTMNPTCVLKFGPQAYLNVMDRVRRENPGRLVLPGVETSPAVRWSGHPAKGNLTLHEPDRHLLVLGLTDAEDLRRLPVLGNPAFGAVAWGSLVVPLLIVTAGFALTLRWPAGLLLVTLGLLATLGQRPFRRPPAAFAEFTRNGYDAAQAVIDYADVKGALAVWAHPNALDQPEPVRYFRAVHTQTRAYPEALAETRDYAGFTWDDADDALVEPGGPWDRVLAEHAAGRRARPAWVFAGLPEREAELRLDETLNAVWPEAEGEDGLLDAFRRGRFYATRTAAGTRVRLEAWAIEAPAGTVHSGGTAVAETGARLAVSLRREALFPARVPRTPRPPMLVTLLRNGRAWRQHRAPDSFEGRFLVPLPDTAAMDVYRLAVSVEGRKVLLANPLFVRASPVE